MHPDVGSIEQFHTGSVRVLCRDEARVFGAEHELVILPVLAAHSQTVPVLVDRYHHAGFRAAPEMLDTSAGADPGKRSRGNWHRPIV